MGIYLNPGTGEFQESLNSKIYIDKTGLIEKTNEVLKTQQKFICVSRPRRFGKSMAADMLAAYYEQEEDSFELFKSLQICHSPSFKKHLNQYDVIKVNMQDFLSSTQNVNEMLNLLKSRLIRDLKRKYPDYVEDTNLIFAMQDIYACTRRPFVILIDEWDCLFREYKEDKDSQKKYLDLFKNDARFRLVYHGAGTDLEQFKTYCEKNNIQNVLFTGAYDNGDKSKLLKDADVLNNCYGGRGGDELRFAISNRFYDGVLFHIPQIVESGGYKARVTEESGVGIALDPTEGAPDRLYDYLMGVDRSLFAKNCDTFLDEIKGLMTNKN